MSRKPRNFLLDCAPNLSIKQLIAMRFVKFRGNKNDNPFIFILNSFHNLIHFFLQRKRKSKLHTALSKHLNLLRGSRGASFRHGVLSQSREIMKTYTGYGEFISYIHIHIY